MPVPQVPLEICNVFRLFVEWLFILLRFVHNILRTLEIWVYEIDKRGYEMMEIANPNDLLKQINRLRVKMIEIGSKKGLNDNETITISKQLDYLLYDYQLLTYAKR